MKLSKLRPEVTLVYPSPSVGKARRDLWFAEAALTDVRSPSTSSTTEQRCRNRPHQDADVQPKGPVEDIVGV